MLHPLRSSDCSCLGVRLSISHSLCDNGRGPEMILFLKRPLDFAHLRHFDACDDESLTSNFADHCGVRIQSCANDSEQHRALRCVMVLLWMVPDSMSISNCNVCISISLHTRTKQYIYIYIYIYPYVYVKIQQHAAVFSHMKFCHVFVYM